MAFLSTSLQKGVASVAKKFNKPVITIYGSLGKEYEDVFRVGINTVMPIIHQVDSLERILAAGYDSLYKPSRNISRLIRINI
ncbi:glycerate kinase [Entomospira nematocerorum]|uniref:Uncharacterized protein n=1 Tax=Entomospira nematocerorum TaxID=2719987 RepID=A0A968GFP1_9SPIO|nr:glycerate kinase [Entomospira nematocera]NIZ46311.1 hypothetical protein [Entomospira nematocera]WDI33885.1 glycerate kinase [Entomospira nematocera]